MFTKIVFLFILNIKTNLTTRLLYNLIQIVIINKNNNENKINSRKLIKRSIKFKNIKNLAKLKSIKNCTKF